MHDVETNRSRDYLNRTGTAVINAYSTEYRVQSMYKGQTRNRAPYNTLINPEPPDFPDAA